MSLTQLKNTSRIFLHVHLCIQTCLMPISRPNMGAIANPMRRLRSRQGSSNPEGKLIALLHRLMLLSFAKAQYGQNRRGIRKNRGKQYSRERADSCDSWREFAVNDVRTKSSTA